MGGLSFAGSSFIVCFPAALGERTCASIARSLFARPEIFLRSTRGAWLGHALKLLIPTQTMWGHGTIPCHTPPLTTKYLGSDYIAVDLIEQEQ